MAVQRLSDLMARSGVKFGTSGARGLVADMSDAVCYAYVAAFLERVATTGDGVVLGHDLRPSSPRIAAACAAAIRDAGRQVRYAGALPTPALASHAMRLGEPAVVVTGSHIPFDRNGIKFYRPDGEISKNDEQAMLAAAIETGGASVPARLPEPDAAAREAYLRRYVGFFEPGSLAGLRVAVWEHSSVARDLLCELLGTLGAEVLRLGRTDTFVPVDTEAVGPEDVERARRWAAEHRFDALLSTDGDADRPLVADERGTFLRGDAVGLLTAIAIGADAVVTPVSSNTAVELCHAFRSVIRTRIGSPYVIAGMAAAARGDAQLVAGYEANGGVLLGSPAIRLGRRLAPLPTRDAVLPMLALLTLARQRRVPLSALADTLPARFTASGRLQAFAPERGAALIARLTYEPEAVGQLLAPRSGRLIDVNLTDGLRARFANHDIVHLRPSGNAPELRCYAEAGTPEVAQALCDAALARIATGQGVAAAMQQSAVG
jgi:phosphomannomutase